MWTWASMTDAQRDKAIATAKRWTMTTDDIGRAYCAMPGEVEEHMTWTEERIDALKTLWGEGFSASQIAAEIGNTSRNAVIGKIHRLGLTRDEIATAKKRASTPRPPARPVAAGVAKKLAATMDVPRSLLVPEHVPSESREKLECGPASVMGLLPHHCRWVIGETSSPEFRFCGSMRKDMTSKSNWYCAAHAARAFVTPAQPKTRAA